MTENAPGCLRRDRGRVVFGDVFGDKKVADQFDTVKV